MKQLSWKKWHISFLLLGVILIPRSALSNPIPPAPPETLIRELNAQNDFEHQVGKRGARGWEVDYRKDLPGYVLTTLREPLILEPGIYRVSFHLRRGIYPKKGLLHNTYGVFRLELWDLTTDEKIAERELQMVDFSKPNKYETRWIDFTMEGREGHVLSPRVHWLGLANGEVEKIDVIQFPDPSPRLLEEKAERLGKLLESRFMENGFVVSRKSDGTPDEIGDGTTYTGWFAASLAWKYSVTKDPFTLQSLENAIQTLHNTIKGTYDRPFVTRYVDGEGTPFENSPSKDPYTSLFFAYSAAYPLLQNEALKQQMALDLERIENRFLKDGLILQEENLQWVSLTPYLTDEEIRYGIRKLFEDKEDYKSFLKNLKKAETYIPFGELWPGSKDVIKALKSKDQEKLFQLTVPTLNGILNLALRVRDILREQYRQDLFPRRTTYKDYPGKKMERLLTECLGRFPRKNGRIQFERISDLKVLGSNSLISLHLVRTAYELSKKDQFVEYYKNNLYSQDALLKTASDWQGLDEDIVSLTAGNAVADRTRKGYLSGMSLYNLILHEKNPAVKSTYKDIMLKWANSYRRDDNPMVFIIADAALQQKGNIGLAMRALDCYPEDRRGFGSDYWRIYGSHVGEMLGGGTDEKFSREPLPVSHRPKDSFLWQRNSRRLSGDDDSKEYPPADYLFVYWLGRAHHLIPAPPPVANVKKG